MIDFKPMQKIDFQASGQPGGLNFVQRIWSSLAQKGDELIPRARALGQEVGATGATELFGKFTTNIPLSAAGVVVEPIKNIVESIRAGADVLKTAPSGMDATKAILGGFADTLKNIGIGTGESLYNYLEKKATETTVEGKQKSPLGVAGSIAKEAVGD